VRATFGGDFVEMTDATAGEMPIEPVPPAPATTAELEARHRRHRTTPLYLPRGLI